MADQANLRLTLALQEFADSKTEAVLEAENLVTSFAEDQRINFRRFFKEQTDNSKWSINCIRFNLLTLFFSIY